MDALEDLESGGSTNGGEGIELAYRVAQEAFIQDGINRVLLATDGDFNVGPATQDALRRLIEQKRSTGVFLTVLGFGTGNYQDASLDLLSREGNGNFDAFDSQIGKKLWSFQCGAGVNSPPVAYTVNGKEYIAVAAGGNTQLDYKRGNSIFVFALP